MAATKYSKTELLEKYDSEEWRSNFLRVLALSSLLKGSIISANYRVPDDLNDAIALTPYGQQTVNHLVKQEKVGVKEARLQCLLVVSYLEMLVDIDRTDQSKIIDSINRQIQAGDLKYPFIFGRALYDVAADLFTEERDYLNVEDTSKLLEATPVGVWQVDNVITGPFGLLESETRRAMAPTHRVPLQHCVDPACRMVHSVFLTTDQEAKINRCMHQIDEFLAKADQEPSDWAGFIEEVGGHKSTSFDDLSLSSIPFALGDLLSVEELRTLLNKMLKSGSARRVRTFLEGSGRRGPEKALTADLEHAKLMQLILMQSDEAVLASLEESVKTNSISVPKGEVRVLKVNRNVSKGVWGLKPELSAFGLRFESAVGGLPQLRLRRLIHNLYTVPESDLADLDWQLRAVSGSSLEGRREEYLRTASPKEVIQRLILRDRVMVEETCRNLRIAWGADDSDDYLADAILWKLGFSLAPVGDAHAEFWPKHDEMTNLARAATLSTTVDEDRISSGAGVYFKALERLLEDSLVYSTWALCFDHYRSPHPFVYNYDSVREEVMEMLSKASIEESGVHKSVAFGENNALFSLTQGFRVLAGLLTRIRSGMEDGDMERLDLPRYVGKTLLKEFPFGHSVMFLDLLKGSQDKLIQDLGDFSRSLSSSEILESRNSLLHFRRSTANVDKLTDALEKVRTSVRRAEQAGIVRTLYSRARTVVDEWGRSTLSLVGRDGQVVNFSRPNAYDWVGLPGLKAAQYLFHYAVFEEPNEMLRFAPGWSSEYTELWSNFPRRPKSIKASVAKQAQSAIGEQDARFSG
ncbi:hypothetical protein [Prescottella equi]|uniref:hypothetical protein n=1 Tax=Rhodococcus hoagii TaxID=43767 RepID=UPI0011323F0C|nr:hypothetical protein [Prescottella equi]